MQGIVKDFWVEENSAKEKLLLIVKLCQDQGEGLEERITF